RACLESALRLCLAAIHDQAVDVTGEVEQLRKLAQRARPTPGAVVLLEAAGQAGIPVHRLTSEGLLLLGQGSRQRRFLAGQPARTGAMAEPIASDRDLTRSLLQAVGVPPPPPDGPDTLPAAGQASAPRSSWRLLVVGERVTAASDAMSPAGAPALIHP